jgi:hypothetical protein
MPPRTHAGGGAPTAAQVATGVWNAAIRTLTALGPIAAPLLALLSDDNTAIANSQIKRANGVTIDGTAVIDESVAADQVVLTLALGGRVKIWEMVFDATNITTQTDVRTFVLIDGVPDRILGMDGLTLGGGPYVDFLDRNHPLVTDGDVSFALGPDGLGAGNVNVKYECIYELME